LEAGPGLNVLNVLRDADDGYLKEEPPFLSKLESEKAQDIFRGSHE
jgi:hypothetical protein